MVFDITGNLKLYDRWIIQLLLERKRRNYTLCEMYMTVGKWNYKSVELLRHNTQMRNILSLV